jgi:hypothetical protein
MEPASIILIVMIGFMGVLALLIGYFIKQGQVSEAISLPNLPLGRIKDWAGFNRFIGSRVMGIGLLGLLAAALIGIVPTLTQVAIMIFTLGTAIISIQAVLFHKRYF